MAPFPVFLNIIAVFVGNFCIGLCLGKEALQPRILEWVGFGGGLSTEEGIHVEIH